MKTNHPANSPVSLDRLRQIREILSKAAAQSDGGNLGYAMADAVKVIDDLLEVRKAEPVSDRDELTLDYLQGHKDGLEWAAQLAEANHPQTGDWLYDDPIELAKAIRKGPDMPDGDGNSLSKCSLREGVEAIRKSCIPVDVDKIQSECDAGNSPVTPDGWIPVSERMPDKLIPVMVMYEDGEMWSAMWNGNSWDDGTEYPDPHEVTHWREMPAAPQQEVK